MSETTLSDEEAYTITWDDEIDAILHKWEAFVSGQDFRDGCEDLLETIKDQNATKLLVDTQGIQAHDEEDTAWLMEDWLPRVIDAGVMYSVNVYPESVIAEMEMEDVSEQISDTPLTQTMTDDKEEARDWLKQQ